MIWNRVPLSSGLGQVVRGVTYSQRDVSSTPQAGHVPILRAGNIVGGRLVTDRDLVWVPDKFVAEEQYLQPSDVVVCSSSGSSALVGKAAIFEGTFCGSFGAFNAVIRVTPALDARFLYYWMQSDEYLSWRNVQAKGANIQNLRHSDLAVLRVPWPAPSEQHRVVELLDQADDLRRKRAEADSNAAQVLPALFLSMFGDPATNPKNFPVLPLGDPKVGALDRGRSRNRPRNDPSLLGGPYPLIQTGDIARCDGRVRSYSQTYSELGLSQSKMWPAGTLCITIAANIAETGVLEFDACFPDSIVGFVPGELTRTEYVQFFLSFLQPVLERNAPQAAQKNINLEILRKLPCPLPPLQLQDKFAALVKEQYGTRQLQIRAGEHLDSMWSGLVHSAFGGALTAAWRQSHSQMLLREIEEQARRLASAESEVMK